MCLYFKVRPYDFRWFYFTMKKQSSFPMLQPSLQHSPVNAIKLTLPIMVSLIQHLLRWAIQELSVTVQHVQYSHPHGTGGRWSGNTVPLTTSPTSVSSRASSRAVRRTQQFVLASRSWADPGEAELGWGICVNAQALPHSLGWVTVLLEDQILLPRNFRQEKYITKVEGFKILL